jgi:hypothetical protein
MGQFLNSTSKSNETDKEDDSEDVSPRPDIAGNNEQ